MSAMLRTRQAGFDVLNALTLLDNNMFLGDQKVGFFSRLSDFR